MKKEFLKLEGKIINLSHLKLIKINDGYARFEFFNEEDTVIKIKNIESFWKILCFHFQSNDEEILIDVDRIIENIKFMESVSKRI